MELVQGAAHSTLVTRIIEVILYLIAMQINDFSFKTKMNELTQITLPLLKQIILKAVPFYINDMLWQSSNSVILKCFGTRGEINYSAYAIASTFMDIFHTFDGGIGTSITVLVSQKLGNNLVIAKDCGYQAKGFSLIASLLLFIAMMLSSILVPLLYSGSGSDIILITQKLIILQCFGFLFYELSMMNYYIFKAGGDTKSILIMDCGLVWAIHVPLLIFTAYFTSFSIYILMIINIFAEVIKFVTSTYLFKKECWLKMLAR